MLRQYDTLYDLNVLITLRVSRRDYGGEITSYARETQSLDSNITKNRFNLVIVILNFHPEVYFDRNGVEICKHVVITQS